MTEINSQSRSTKASFEYLCDLPKYQTEKLYEIWVEAPADVPKTNREFEVHHGITVQDARPNLADFTPETTGFCFLHRPMRERISIEELEDHEETGTSCPPKLQTYLQDCIAHLCSMFAAEHAICYDWRVRSNLGPQSYKLDYYNTSRTDLNAFRIVHTDESYQGGFATIRKYLSESELSKYGGEGWRIRIVNCWRPLVSVVSDTPLAFCDRRTVDMNDVLPCDKIMEQFVDESFYVKYNDKHRWFYLSDQTCDEVALFLIWDSQLDDQYLVGPPHAAFNSPHADPTMPKRVSLEARFIIFSENVEDNGSTAQILSAS